MGTVADLTPTELESEIARVTKAAPLSLAWAQHATGAAAEKQASAVDKMATATATDLSELRTQAELLAVFSAAAAMAVDVTSSLDMPMTMAERDRKAVERAVAMFNHVKQAMVT